MRKVWDRNSWRQSKEASGRSRMSVGKAYDFAQSSPTLNDMANHGRTELAAASFHDANAYVMYQRGSHDQPSPEVSEPEITQSKGISM